MAASRGEHAICPPGLMLNNRYKIVKECGCGNFSKVYECVDTKGENQRVAVKLLKREYASDAAFEKDILKALGSKDPRNSKKVSKMLDFFVHQRYPTFVFPLKGPSLRSCKLGVTRGNLPAEEMKRFSFEMLQTMDFLHREVKMVHTDLKPENILLDTSVPKDGNTIGAGWTICDFGSASFLRPDKLDSDLISTRPYRAPEVVLGNGWSTSADIWSLACVMFEVQAGSRLFEVHDDAEHLHAFEARLSKLPSIFTKQSRYSSRYFNTDGSHKRSSSKSIRSIAEVLKDNLELLDLLRGMLEYDPKHRLSATEALKHPYFASLQEEAARALAAAEFVKKEPSPPSSAAHPPIPVASRRERSPLEAPAAAVNNIQMPAKQFAVPEKRTPLVKPLDRLKSAQISTRDILAAGKPSYSARTGTLAIGRYY